MSTRTTGTIAVFGATGQQGGAVVDALLDHKARVRALVRDPQSDRAQALAARGAELAAIRADDPASLAAALATVEGFYFMTPEANGLEEVEAEIRIGTALVDAAVEAGVPHVVFNSVFGADRESGVPHHDSKHAIEEHLRKSGLRAAMVRATAFMENFASGSARRDDVDIDAHGGVEAGFVGEEVQDALVRLVKYGVGVVPLEGLVVAVELERPHDVRVVVVAAEHPVHGPVRVVRAVQVGAQLEELLTLAGLGLEA